MPRKKALRPFERRAAGGFPYYRLAVWEPRSFTFKDNATPHATPEAAQAAARTPGKYRITEVSEDGTAVYATFEK